MEDESPSEYLCQGVLDYASQNGVARSKAEAVQFLRQAAERGEAEAQFLLGCMLSMGNLILASLEMSGLIGIPLSPDPEIAREGAAIEALVWFRRAAAQGHSDALKRVGLAYVSGAGVEKDLAEAFRWLRKAVEQDATNADACFFMGNAYITGWGVPPDPTEAAHWHLRAAERGHAYAQGALGASYERGRGVAQDLARALHWYQAAAAQGHFPSCFRLGVMYLRGEGVSRDYGKAFGFLQVAAARAVGRKKPLALLNLGSMYEHGCGVVQSPDQARAYYTQASAACELFAEDLLPVVKEALARVAAT